MLMDMCVLHVYVYPCICVCPCGVCVCVTMHRLVTTVLATFILEIMCKCLIAFAI